LILNDVLSVRIPSSEGSSMSRDPIVNTPPAGRTIAVVGDVYHFFATGEDTNGK
jgi:hypothetical protein